MVSRLDARQSRQRALLDQLSNNTDVKLDTLLNLVNDELTPVLRLRAANPTTLSLNVDSISVVTSDAGEGHGRTKTIQPISGVIPSFTPGSVNFPSATAGAITATGLTLAASYTLNVATGQWIKVLLALNSDGQIVLSFGNTGASEAAAILPTADAGTLPIGYVALQNITGTIQNVSGSRIYQFAGGGGGGGSGGGYFKNYLEAFFNSDSSVTVNNGGVSAAGNRTAPAASWASPNTANFSFSRVTSGALRGQYSFQTSGSASGAAAFVESPTFVLDASDREAGAGSATRFLTILLEAQLTGSATTFEIALVRYNSANVFQDETSFGTFVNSTVERFPVAVTDALAVYNTADSVAVRIRRSSGTEALTWDRTTVTPDQPITNGRQRLMGQKVFLKGVQTLNAVVITDAESTDIIPSGETRFAGRLVVPASRTINVSGDLAVVGAITGTGTLTGSGVITSV
jgi:hypothetical protein